MLARFEIRPLPYCIMTSNDRALHIEGAAATLPLLLAGGPVFTALALFFKVDVFLLALVAAVPMLVQGIQLAGPWLIRHTKSPVRLFRVATAFRWSWALLLIAALAGLRSPIVFLLVFVVTQAAAAVAGNAWMSILQECVAEQHRGAFFGRRNIIVSAVTIIAMPVMTWSLESLPGPWGVAAVLLLAVSANAVAFRAASAIRETEESLARVSEMTTRVPVRHLLGDRPVRRMIVLFVLWNAIIQFSAPYFSYHQIVNIGLSMNVLGIHMVALSLCTIAGSRIWGAVADRLGVKSLTVTGVLVIAVTPAMWMLMNPATWRIALVLDVILASIGWSAINIGLATLPMEVAPRDHVSSFYALYFAGGGLGGVIGGITGGLFAGLLEPIRFSMFDVPFFGLQLLLLIAAVLRLLIVPLIQRVPTKRYVPPSDVWISVVSLVARRTPIRVWEIGRMVQQRFISGRDRMDRA